MARDDLNPGDKQAASTFPVQGKEVQNAECSGRIDCDETGGNFNIMSVPTRPPMSPFRHGDMLRMPQVIPHMDVPAQNSSSISFQQPRIGHGFQMMTDNSPSLHPIVPDIMDPFFEEPMHDSLVTANNMQNVATNLHGFQNPQFDSVSIYDANNNDHMAMLEYRAIRNNIYPSSFMENVGNINNRAYVLSQTPDGEEYGTSNRVLQSSIQSQGNLDGSFLTPRVGGNMDLPSIRNSWRGYIPGNYGSLIFPQVTSNIQNAVANPSEAGAGGHFATDNFGGSGRFGSGFTFDQFLAPERPQAYRQHFIPPNNRNLEWNTQAGQILMHPSNLSQGSLSVSPLTGFRGQAELPNSRQSRGTEIPTSSPNSVHPGSGRLDNQNLIQLPGQFTGSGEPISLMNNPQPVSHQLHRLSGLSIGELSSESFASTGPVARGNQSDNFGEPLPTSSLQSFRNYGSPAYTSSPAASLERTNASSQASRVHIRPSLKRGASEISSSTSLLHQKKARATQASLYPSVPYVPSTTGAPLSSTQTISSRPSQMITADSTPPVPISASLSPLLRTSSVRTLPQGALPLPSMSPIPSPDPPVSTAAPISPSRAHPTTLSMPQKNRLRSDAVPFVPRKRLLANSTPNAHLNQQGSNETLQPIGEKCYLCNRDLAFPAEGAISQPTNPPDVAVLPCGHTFHDICLLKITPKDQAGNPPCIPCAIGET